MTDSKWSVIINPASGNGKAKTLWPKIKGLLEKHRFDFEFSFTKNGGHNIELIQNTIKQGFKSVICIGGDGTIHNTINGIMLQNKVKSDEISLGVIPIGTGNDWIKTHDLSKDIEDAILTIKSGKTSVQDIGKIEFLNDLKPPVFFNNLAGIGFDGFVVSKVEKYKHLGSISYLVGAVLGLFSFKNFEVEVVANNKHIKTKSLMVLVGLCKFSGGGMRLTDFSSYDNGLFDITVIKNLSKLNVIANLTKLYNGTLTQVKNVAALRSNEIVIKVKQNKKPFIQADGELIGVNDIKVSLLPKAIRFYSK